MNKETDLDVSNTDNRISNETKKGERKLAQKLYAVEEKLKKTYLFTQQQLYDVFHKNTDQDWYFFEQIIRDVEQQYIKTPMWISINEYLYANLMSIEDLHLETRKQTIVDTIHDTLDWENTRTISYLDFLPNGTFSNDVAWKHMKEYVKNSIQDFFVIHIQEDVSVDKNNKENKNKITSKLIQQYISRSRMSGINFYIFVQKDGTKRIGVGVQKWTTGTTNDIYFGDLAKKYNATKVTIPLSHFISPSYIE